MQKLQPRPRRRCRCALYSNANTAACCALSTGQLVDWRSLSALRRLDPWRAIFAFSLFFQKDADVCDVREPASSLAMSKRRDTCQAHGLRCEGSLSRVCRRVLQVSAFPLHREADRLTFARSRSSAEEKKRMRGAWTAPSKPTLTLIPALFAESPCEHRHQHHLRQVGVTPLTPSRPMPCQ